jgi:hypothetical protein
MLHPLPAAVAALLAASLDSAPAVPLRSGAEVTAHCRTIDVGLVPASAIRTPAGVRVSALDGGGWGFAFQDYLLAESSRAGADANEDAAQVLLNGNIFVQPFDIDAEVELSPQVRVAFTNTVRTGLSVEIRGGYTASVSELIRVAEIPLPIIPIVPPEVEVEPYLLIYLQLSGRAEIGMRAGFEREAECVMGVEYLDGDISFSYDSPTQTGSPGMPQVSGQAGLTLEVACVAGTAFVPWIEGIPTIGPTICASASTTLDVAPLGDPWWSISAGYSILYGNYDLAFGPRINGTLYGPEESVILASTTINEGTGTGSLARWAKTLEFDGNSQVQGARIAAASEQSYLVFGTRGLTNGFLFQAEEDGTITWAQESNRLIEGVAVASAGGYFAVANSSTTGGGEVLRLDGDGNLDWARKVVGPTTELIDLCATTDGGVVASGVVLEEGEFYWALLKLDGSGELLWARRYGVSYNEGARRVWELESGELLVAGSNKWADGGGMLMNGNAFVARLEASGAVLWSRSVGTPRIDKINDAAPTPGAEGGAVLVGQVGGEDNAAWALAVDGSGELLWSRVFAGEERGGANDRIGGDTPWDAFRGVISLGGERGYLLLGDTSIGADEDGWAVRLGSLRDDGALQWFRSFRGVQADNLQGGCVTAEGVLVAGTTESWPVADGTARVLLGYLSEEGSARIQRDLGGDDLFEFAQQGGTQSVVCVDDSVQAVAITELTIESTTTPTMTPVMPIETEIYE